MNWEFGRDGYVFQRYFSSSPYFKMSLRCRRVDKVKNRRGDRFGCTQLPNKENFIKEVVKSNDKILLVNKGVTICYSGFGEHSVGSRPGIR